VEESEEVREPLATARAKDRNQTFRAGQLADSESMPDLFERSQVIERPLLVSSGCPRRRR
jgi:arsenate reductase-like glutaredoxin family protein